MAEQTYTLIGHGENVVTVSGTSSRILLGIGDEVVALAGPEARELVAELQAQIERTAALSAADADRRVKEQLDAQRPRTVATLEVRTTPEGKARLRDALGSGRLLRALQERGIGVTAITEAHDALLDHELIGREEHLCTGEDGDDTYESREERAAREERESTAEAAGGRDE